MAAVSRTQSNANLDLMSLVDLLFEAVEISASERPSCRQVVNEP
jgi:hypothetical protein